MDMPSRGDHELRQRGATLDAPPNPLDRISGDNSSLRMIVCVVVGIVIVVALSFMTSASKQYANHQMN